MRNRILALLMSVVCSLAAARLEPEHFVPTYAADIAHPNAPASDALTAHAADFEYVFIGGFLGDFINRIGAFAPLGAELRALGVPPSQFHIVCPSSARTVEDNARNFLPSRLAEIAAGTSRKLVVVAYSKGAPEFLTYAFEHPALIEERVEGVFFMEGAFGGSPLADFIETRPAPRLTTRLSNRVGMRSLRRLALLVYPWLAGVKSVTTSESVHRIEGWLAEYASVIERLHDKLVFVQAWADPKRATYRLKMGTRFITAVTGLKSDGVIPLEAQIVPGIGTLSIVLDGVDHSLPCSRVLTGRGPSRVRAFTRAMVSCLGH